MDLFPVPRRILLEYDFLKGWLKWWSTRMEFCWILRWLSRKKAAKHLICIFLFGSRERLFPGGTYDLQLFGCQDSFAVSSTHTTNFLCLHLLQETNGYIHFVYLHDCKSIFLYACIKHLDNRGMSVPYYSVGKLYKFQRRRSAAVFARSPPFLRPKKQISPVL